MTRTNCCRHSVLNGNLSAKQMKIHQRAEDRFSPLDRLHRYWTYGEINLSMADHNGDNDSSTVDSINSITAAVLCKIANYVTSLKGMVFQWVVYRVHLSVYFVTLFTRSTMFSTFWLPLGDLLHAKMHYTASGSLPGGWAAELPNEMHPKCPHVATKCRHYIRSR